MPGIRRGLLSVTQRVLRRVGSRVARDGLFEQPGERPRTPPLPPAPSSAAPSSAAPSSEGEGPAAGDEPAEEDPTAADLDALRRALGPTGQVRVVNHWATWCDPCVEELPALRELAAELAGQATVLGLSWDLFDPRDEADAVVAQVGAFARAQGMDWPGRVVTAAPEAFFAAFDIRWQKIPQTWVLDRQGRVRLRVEGVLDADGAARVRQAVAAAQA